MTLDRIAHGVGLSRVALTRGFRDLYGESVFDFMRRLRLDKSMELLRDETLSIAQVAAQVGYLHSCNFATAFRCQFGYSPKRARALLAA